MLTFNAVYCYAQCRGVASVFPWQGFQAWSKYLERLACFAPVSVIRNSFETPTTVHRHVEDAARALHQGPDEGH